MLYLVGGKVAEKLFLGGEDNAIHKNIQHFYSVMLVFFRILGTQETRQAGSNVFKRNV
jgi:hypothetical protein